jgi:hypothetical protein
MLEKGYATQKMVKNFSEFAKRLQPLASLGRPASRNRPYGRPKFTATLVTVVEVLGRDQARGRRDPGRGSPAIPGACQSHCSWHSVIFCDLLICHGAFMIINSFNELRALIDRILLEMLDCTPQQTYQIERQIRSAHAYLAQRDVPPREALDRIGHMASMAAIQLEPITCDVPSERSDYASANAHLLRDETSPA